MSVFSKNHLFAFIMLLSFLQTRSQSTSSSVVILTHGWNLFWGKNESWVQDWIPILTAQGYAVLAPDHFLYGERKVYGGFDQNSNRVP